ncbi:DNA polymerase lambda-like isoform X2 [Oscarella lobularis]|uniref:DNA polymerase lambda-like isoform X2 n=1 Tax=Oscarella lobularis TaxID=121494 RepID=UPI003313744B
MKKSRKRKGDPEERIQNPNGFLQDVKSLILEPKLGKARAEILGRQLLRNGGARHDALRATDTTHVLVDNDLTFSQILQHLKISQIPDGILVVRADWLSRCLVAGEKLPTVSYEVREETAKYQSDSDVTSATESSPEKQLPDGKYFCHKKPTAAKSLWDVVDDDSDYIDSDDGEFKSESSQSASQILTQDDDDSAAPAAKKLKGRWACAQPSTALPSNVNKHITDKLEVLQKAYTNTNDTWRSMMYKKAITALKSHPKEVTTYEEALEIPFVGKRLADKIMEIVSTGRLRKIDHLDPQLKTINLFTEVWGAGPTTARRWADQGFKTLDDLVESGCLTRQQSIGVKHYDDIKERIPRDEVEEIAKMVRETALAIVPGLETEVCGSYRRGKATCGDIDMLLSHPDGRSHSKLFKPLLARLTDQGFLTDDLVIQEDGTQQKYLGVCKLPGEGKKHRRLDVIVVPYSEWACSLLYFTGSGYFNRSMRLYAHKKSMQLSQHGLYTNVIRRNREVVHQGQLLPCFSERDVFKHLGLDYLEPNERER